MKHRAGYHGCVKTFSLSPYLVALAATLWGLDLLLRPEALRAGWSPALLVLVEHLILSLLFVRTLWQERERLGALTGSQWGTLLFVSWGGSALATWLYTEAFALDGSQALTVILLQKTQPLVTLGLAGLLLGERRSPLFWGWAALALAGAYLLIGLEHPPHWGEVRATQALLALGASVLWGASTVASRSLMGALTPQGLTGVRFALAVPVLCLLLLLPQHAPFLPPSPFPTLAALLSPAAYALLFLGLIVLLPDLLGMRLYYQGLKGTPASVATLAELCYPLSSLMIGVGLQHAGLGSGQWAGLVLLLLAVWGLGQRPAVVLSPLPAAAD